MNLNKTFEMNGKAYRTDEQTLNTLRSVVDSQEQRDTSSDEISPVGVVMMLGFKTGRIERL